MIYGDTSQDGVRYSNDQPAASVNGTKFNNPGNDTIDASAMPDKADGFVGVVIYGGAGNDTIKGSQDDDHLAGGVRGRHDQRRSRQRSHLRRLRRST